MDPWGYPGAQRHQGPHEAKTAEAKRGRVRGSKDLAAHVAFKTKDGLEAKGVQAASRG